MKHADVADVEHVCLPICVLVFVDKFGDKEADDETDKEGDYLDKDRYNNILR